MKTIRRYLYGEVLSSVTFVTLGFLALFFFFDLVDELRWVNQGGYHITQALIYVALAMPSHLYELFPITVLIGTIFVMASLAQSSEFTILRTSGLGPWKALRTLLVLGLAFVVTTFAVGDYLAPATERVAQLMKARYQGRLTTGQTGAWMKEKQDYSSYAVNIARMTPEGDMQKIRIFEFDNQGRMVSMTNAEHGRFNQDDAWLLLKVHRVEFRNTERERAHVEPSDMAEYRWPTRISAEMASAALLKPDRMRTIDLFQYIQHLDANGQSAQSYEIEFWRKVFYPLSCLVMVVLALPFAYLHFRSGGIAAYVFGGVMAGISFFLLNNVFGYIGNLQNWTPWLVAASPGMIYSLLSLAAFGWLVLRR
ncbi:LPS export ABC transporter permease LptG [Curvibacter sp. RS43]|uniref:LPS export ABC transporter permease LptG n=1 Tax=Curvibacter microcysteis TaxID=3026419 RepID=UPI00235E2584|nr:LPS export ABC transporter permease LptG [Curvibacter sp. RS43]MDD0810115.1 LPS export ABC transporter permease LptG [Curvibacter sp. RS43]